MLKVAILAEKYAVDYTWYVDTILNLIRIAGDYVSEEVWYRVIQIVINRDEVQGYAAKTVFEVGNKSINISVTRSLSGCRTLQPLNRNEAQVEVTLEVCMQWTISSCSFFVLAVFFSVQSILTSGLQVHFLTPLYARAHVLTMPGIYSSDQDLSLCCYGCFSVPLLSCFVNTSRHSRLLPVMRT